MAQGPELSIDLIPERIRQTAQNVDSAGAPTPIRPGMTLQQMEKEFIAATLEATKGNKKAAALQLGISRRALYNKLAKHSLL
jgi:DNA-binding NtrC family response regulator